MNKRDADKKQLGSMTIAMGSASATVYSNDVILVSPNMLHVTASSVAAHCIVRSYGGRTLIGGRVAAVLLRNVNAIRDAVPARARNERSPGHRGGARGCANRS